MQPLAVRLRAIKRLADRLTRLATARPAWRRPRNALLRVLGSLPPFQRRLAWRLSGLVNRRGEPRGDAPAAGAPAKAPC